MSLGPTAFYTGGHLKWRAKSSKFKAREPQIQFHVQIPLLSPQHFLRSRIGKGKSYAARRDEETVDRPQRESRVLLL